MAKVKIKVNDHEIEVEEGLNLIEAARAASVEIPHFCYHPGLGVDGNCRMCLIEVDGVAKPQIACNSYAKEGLSFRTETPRVKEMQRSVLEFLFLNHPLDCPICDQSGECYLQDYYMTNGQYLSRLDTSKVHKRKVQRIGERVVLDAERCVLCTRCIRFCDEITGTGELYIVNRGNRSEITTYPSKPLDNPYSLNTVDVCPVGALTSSQFRFRKRVWHLESVESICTGCARGCNIYLEEDDGQVYRYRPRENMEVNRYWMCDHGRTTYLPLNDNRLDVAMSKGEELGYSVAVQKLTALLNEAAGKGSDVQVLLSPQSSLETLFAMKRFAAEVLGTDRIGTLATRPPFVEDEILRKRDANPNSAGITSLGLDKDPRAGLARGGALLVVVEDDPLGNEPKLKPDFDRFARVLYLGTNENDTSAASDLAMPITPHSECSGSFINFQGRVQRFQKAITPPGDPLWTPLLLQQAAMRIGQRFGWADIEALWADLVASEPAFAGLSWDSLVHHGRRLGESVPVGGRSR